MTDAPETGRRERSTRATRRGGPRRGVDPKRLAIVVVLVALIALTALAVWLLLGRLGGGVRLGDFPRDSKATVSYAGALPGKGVLPSVKGIAIRDERLYAAVADAGAIRVSGLDGSRAATLPLPAASEGVAAYPVDIAALPDGKLAVVDTAGNRVLLLSSAGGVETTIRGQGAPASGETTAAGETLLAPTAVEAGAGEVFVADGGDHTIKVYRPDGTFVRSMGAALTPRLTFVGGMAYSGGELYVSDSANGRVLVLDAGSGAQTATLQQRFDLPRGVATWPGGVLVADVFGRKVTVANAEGKPTDEIPGSSEEGKLAAPEDVAFDEDSGRAYVSDSVLGKVLVYNLRTQEEARGAE